MLKTWQKSPAGGLNVGPVGWDSPLRASYAYHKQAAAKLREVMATYEKNRDLILLGAYNYGTDPKVDYAIDKIEEVEDFLRQPTHDLCTFEEMKERLTAMFADAT